MTSWQALNTKQPRPLWRNLGRFVIDLCHACILAAFIVVPGAIAWNGVPL